MNLLSNKWERKRTGASRYVTVVIETTRPVSSRECALMEELTEVIERYITGGGGER